MKKIFILVITLMSLPAFINAEKTIGNYTEAKINAVPTDVDANPQAIIAFSDTVAVYNSRVGSPVFYDNHSSKGNNVENGRNSCWFEVLIKATETKDYQVVLNVSSDRSNAFLDVAYYQTYDVDNDTLITSPDVLYGERKAIPKNGWANYSDYYFDVSLKADEVYTLRISFVNGTGEEYAANIKTINVIEPDLITMTELMVDSTSVANFDPYTLGYDLGTLAQGTTEIEISAVASDSTATITGTGIIALEEGLNTLLVTAETPGGRLSYTYRITAIMPILDMSQAVPSTLDLLMSVANKGIGEITATTLDRILGSNCYVKYEIKPNESGEYLVNVVHGTKYDCAISVETSTDGVSFTDPIVLNCTKGVYEDTTLYPFGVSLSADEITTLKISYVGGAGTWLGTTHSIAVAKNNSAKITSTEEERITWRTQIDNIELTCGDRFLGGQVEIYTLSGLLVAKTPIEANTSNFSVKGNSVYLIRVIDGSKQVSQTMKCVVR